MTFHETLGSEGGIYNLNLQMVSSGETLNRRKIHPFRSREFSRETQGLPFSHGSVPVQPAACPLNSLLFCCSDNTTQARPLTDRIVYLGLQFQKERSYWWGGIAIGGKRNHIFSHKQEAEIEIKLGVGQHSRLWKPTSLNEFLSARQAANLKRSISLSKSTIKQSPGMQTCDPMK